MLDYKLVEALAMVAQENGFERAAQKIHITQSAVSQRIRALEEQCGQVLLVRTTPPRATAAGQRMIKHYLQVRRLEDDLQASFKPSDQHDFTVLSLGINDDSLATWFIPAILDFICKERVLLDLRKDDQERTHQLLKDGKVIGCISSKAHPMQGCRVTYLGDMIYHMVATQKFMVRWFPRGFSRKTVGKAPLLRFNRSDQLHNLFFEKVLDITPDLDSGPIHYLPSTEKFVDYITAGLAYGMLIDHQCRQLLSEGVLVELIPNTPIEVGLYWHCWNLKSSLLARFSDHLIKNAGKILTR